MESTRTLSRKIDYLREKINSLKTAVCNLEKIIDRGTIISSPNGTVYKLIISDEGEITAELITE